MDFDKYVNSLNELDNQENKTELESFYTLHSAVLQFFKAIEKTLQDLMTKSSVSPIVIKQLENVLPMLTKLKYDVSIFDSNRLSIKYKSKINQLMTYIKEEMVISELDAISNQFFDLLKENETAFVAEQEEKKLKEKEEADRRAKAEKERKEKERKQRDQELWKQVQKKLDEEKKHKEKEFDIKITRKSKFWSMETPSDWMATADIYIDNLFCGRLKRNETKNFRVNGNTQNLKIQHSKGNGLNLSVSSLEGKNTSLEIQLVQRGVRCNKR